MPKRLYKLEPFWWWDADTRAVEAFSAVMAMVWGFVLLLTADMSASPGYRIMHALMPTWGWGLFFVFVWLIQSAAMCGNVRLLRFPSALLAFIVWTAVAIAISVANPSGLGYTYFVMAAAQAWVLWKGPTKNGK